jgi:hypothetical protein
MLVIWTVQHVMGLVGTRPWPLGTLRQHLPCCGAVKQTAIAWILYSFVQHSISTAMLISIALCYCSMHGSIWISHVETQWQHDMFYLVIHPQVQETGDMAECPPPFVQQSQLMLDSWPRDGARHNRTTVATPTASATRVSLRALHGTTVQTVKVTCQVTVGLEGCASTSHPLYALLVLQAQQYHVS